MARSDSLINKKKYVFLPYDKEYPLMFLEEKHKLKKSLGENIEIEHVGSTSVPGLGGKGIIDIIIRTPKSKLNQFIIKLKKEGYEYNSEHKKDSRRVFLQRTIKYAQKERRMHIHLVLTKRFWDSFIFLRDYLRIHNEERDRYSKIKEDAVLYASGEGKKYREYKDKFLEDVMDKIRKKMPKS